MNRDDAIRELFKGSAVVGIGLVLELGISFIGKALVAQYLGRVDYGLVHLGVAFMSFGAALGVLGLNSGVARYLPRYDDTRQPTVVRTGLLLALPLPASIGAITVLWPELVAGALGAPGSENVIRLFGLAVPIVAFVRVAIGIVRGRKSSFPQVLVQNIAIPTTRIVAIATGIVAGSSVVWMAGAYVLPYVVALVLCVYFIRKYLTGGNGAWIDAELGSEMVVFSIPLALSAVMSGVLTDLDTFLLSYYYPTGVVGDYGVIYPIASLITTGITASGFLFLPVLSEQHEAGRTEEMSRMYQVVTKWVFMATLPVVLVIAAFPRVTISVTFGAEYAGAAFALQILALGFFVDAVFGLNSGFLSSVGETVHISIAQAVAVVVNLGLNLLLIPEYSYVGAAIATTVSFATMNVIISSKLYRDFGVQPFSRSLVRPAAFALPAFLLIQFVVGWVAERPLVVLLITAPTFVVVYVVSVLRYGGIEEEEVMIVRSVEERFGVDLDAAKRFSRRIGK